MRNDNCDRPLRIIARLAICLAALMLAAAAGCGKSPVKNQADEGLLPEAVAVREVFDSASPSYKNPVTEVLNLVKAGKVNPVAYVEALPQVERLAANPTMSSEQKQVLEALAQKLKTEISGRNSR